MSSEPVVIPVSGLVTFDSLSDLRAYVKQLLSYYDKQFDVYSQKVGSLMRLCEKKEAGSEARRLNTDDWKKVGKLMVNTRDTLYGTLELMLEAMEEFKVKSARTSEVLTSFDSLEEINIPEGASITLYLRNGVPQRVLVENLKESPRVEAMPAVAP